MSDDGLAEPLGPAQSTAGLSWEASHGAGLLVLITTIPGLRKTFYFICEIFHETISFSAPNRFLVSTSHCGVQAPRNTESQSVPGTFVRSLKTALRIPETAIRSGNTLTHVGFFFLSTLQLITNPV